jgi:hypothetical protein
MMSWPASASTGWLGCKTESRGRQPLGRGQRRPPRRWAAARVSARTAAAGFHVAAAVLSAARAARANRRSSRARSARMSAADNV